jgi:hypothetical protein
LELSVASVLGRARLIPLVELAVLAAELGMFDRAAAYLAEVQAASPGPLELHDLNTVAGVLALNENDFEGACRRLSASVRVCQTPGLLAARGPLPNLLLAKRLLEIGEEAPVIGYLTECKRYWRHCADAIEQWIGLIQKGPSPAIEPEILRATNCRMVALKMQALVLIGTGGRALSADEVADIEAERKRDGDAATKGRLETGTN